MADSHAPAATATKDLSIAVINVEPLKMARILPTGTVGATYAVGLSSQGGAAPAAVAPAEGSPSPTTPRHSISMLSCPWALGLAGYALIAGGFMTLVIVGRRRLKRWVREAHAVKDIRTLAAFAAAARRMDITQRVAVLESRHARAPLALGTLRPAVLLPVGLRRS